MRLLVERTFGHRIIWSKEINHAAVRGKHNWAEVLRRKKTSRPKSKISIIVNPSRDAVSEAEKMRRMR